MKPSVYPTALVPEVELLPYVRQENLRGHGLFVVRGLSIALAEQLIERSKEPHIGLTCPNDSLNVFDAPETDMSKKRFLTIESIIKWMRKGRLVIPLVREGSRHGLELMGLGWMRPGVPDGKKGEPNIDGAQTVFAVRLYEGALGQGNAEPYTEAITTAHGHEFGNAGVWLGTWGDNERAIKPYKQAGFIEVARTMGERHGEQIERVYMTLGNISAQAA